MLKDLCPSLHIACINTTRALHYLYNLLFLIKKSTFPMALLNLAKASTCRNSGKTWKKELVNKHERD